MSTGILQYSLGLFFSLPSLFRVVPLPSSFHSNTLGLNISSNIKERVRQYNTERINDSQNASLSCLIILYYMEDDYHPLKKKKNGIYLTWKIAMSKNDFSCFRSSGTITKPYLFLPSTKCYISNFRN